MQHLVKYYNDLDLGFLYEVEGEQEIPLATFYPDVRGSAWRFIQPPSETGKTFPHTDMQDAVTAFLQGTGVADPEIVINRA